MNNVDTSTLRPITIRHRGSGAWIGYLVGRGDLPDTITIIGRRVWSWVGGRLEFSQLTRQGCRPSDRLGEWEEVTIGAISVDLLELRTADRAVVENARKLAAHVCA